jgi:hypothetical protein
LLVNFLSTILAEQGMLIDVMIVYVGLDVLEQLVAELKRRLVVDNKIDSNVVFKDKGADR